MKSSRAQLPRTPPPPLKVTRGRPVILQNGKPVPQAAYFDRIMRGDWEERVREFVQSGVKVFHLTAPHGGTDYFDSGFWTDDGVYPEEDPARYAYTLDKQARYLLSLQPDARFYIGIQTSVPLAWTRKHADQMQTDENGRTYREATLASERYLRDVAHYMRHLVRYCETRSWGDRIVGYMAVPYGEGTMPLTIAGKLFDCSAANEAAFRQWIRRRYRTLSNLRRAWNDNALTFDAVRIPRDAEWFARKASARPTLNGKSLLSESLPSNGLAKHTGFFHWIEPRQVVRETDYARFMRDNWLRWVRTMAAALKDGCRRLGRDRLVAFDVGKQPLLGWEILSAFDGIGDGTNFPSMLLFSGSWGVGELLDDPNFDAFITPADYTARTVGFAYEAEGLTDSMVIRGKTMVLENDARCYVGAGVHDQGAFRNPAEVEAGLLRNAALTLSRGFQSYWCNIGSSYFHDAKIHRTIERIAPMLDRLNKYRHEETAHAIAFVIDDEGMLYEDFTSGFQYLSVVWQRVRGLAHCGIPYRIYLLSDLEKDSFPEYRAFFFPNLFKVDDRVRRLLKRKVLRNGQVAIFGPATGITTGRTLSAEGATDLLGVDMELAPRSTARHVILQHAGHPITRPLPANLVYGDSSVYGPTLAPQTGAVEKAGAIPLGHANLCWFLHRTGLFLKEEGRGAANHGRPGPRRAGDYAALWSCALPLPACLLREAARHAGCHVWCEEDDVICASESIVAVHTAKCGPRTIRLPGPRTVYDAVTGKRLGRGMKEIRLQLRSPDTRIFQLE